VETSLKMVSIPGKCLSNGTTKEPISLRGTSPSLDKSKRHKPTTKGLHNGKIKMYL